MRELLLILCAPLQFRKVELSLCFQLKVSFDINPFVISMFNIYFYLHLSLFFYSFMRFVSVLQTVTNSKASGQNPKPPSNSQNSNVNHHNSLLLSTDSLTIILPSNTYLASVARSSIISSSF